MGVQAQLGLAVCLVLLAGRQFSCELAEQLDCPEECDCHYFRINWVIDCSDLNLTDIPKDGLDLNVYILNMNSNNLTAISPFPDDIKIRTMELSDNLLTSVKRDYFSTLKYLLDIDLSLNFITYVDPEAFLDNPGLITINLNANPIQPVDGPFLIGRSLLYLYMQECTLSKINPMFFTNLTTLNKLDLSGNPLRIIEPGVFDPLTSLEYLMLNRCNLTYISPSAFDSLNHLKTLELSQNNLKSHIDWTLVLGNLGKLDTLDLRRSGINNLPDNVFANNTWLRNLNLAENELIDLDVATTLGQNLVHLDSLDLSNCHLKGPLSEDAFINATKLRTLYLSGNPLSAADLSVALAPLTKLHRLSLRNCGLGRLPANTFHRFTCLQELDISHNPLIDAFTALLSPLESLEHLDMGYSNLQRISRTTFLKMTSLKTLILSGNKLETLESGLFQNLTHLSVLELNNCGLTRLNETVFHENYTYPDLEELRLSGNPLQVLPTGNLLPPQLSRLRSLDLSKCSVGFLPPNVFNNTRNITSLNLAANNLSMTSELSFQFLDVLKELESIDLSNNNLSHISPSVLRHNRAINSIRLVGNPWKCDCNIADMWEWAIKEKGDIGVLVGSTTPTEIGFGASRKKKGLVCYFDIKTTPTRKRPGRELFASTNKTWARYVKEADCPSSNIFRPPRIISRKTRGAPSYVHIEKLPTKSFLTWGNFGFMAAGIIILSAMAYATFYARDLYKTKQQRIRRNTFKSPCASDDEDINEKSPTKYVMSGDRKHLRRVVK
uniref:Leucine-rich repeat-containing G-protein coupled receptor 6 n=1 Tax=Cacopsylla melanoneura TaxID=428564 RepID=A0A8D9BIR0_9HEMI